MRKLFRLFLSSAVIAAPLSSMANEALLNKYACVACHQAQQKVVGPSWKQISEKYRDGSKTAAQLAASIKSGGSGKWGAMPMPPQSQVSEADLQALATWILSYK
jgi:cytochrome c